MRSKKRNEKGDKPDTDSIIPLISEWESFKREMPRGDLHQFAQWVLMKGKAEPEVSQRPDFHDPVLKGMKLKGDYPNIPTASGLTGYIVVRLFKALRFYFKPVLQKHGLSSIDELFFLATLAWKKELSKKSLCQMNMTDIPTGMDVIKRLLNQGLLSEKENRQDKREKLLTLTKTGWNKIFKVFSADDEMQDVMANLKNDERKVLLKFLDSLNHFHTAIYHQKTT